MSRFIRLAISRQQTGDIILQTRYDEALDRLGPDDHLVKELRARVIDRGLDTRDQGVLPGGDEPWAGQANPMTGGRKRSDYVRDVNDRLRRADGMMDQNERVEANRLGNIIVNETDQALVNEAYSRLEGMLNDIEGRTEPPTFAPRYMNFHGVTGSGSSST